MKRVASPGLMHDTGCLGLVHWDDPEGWWWEGGGRRVNFKIKKQKKKRKKNRKKNKINKFLKFLLKKKK